MLLQCWISILNMATFSNNLVSVRVRNAHEPRLQTSDCSEHSASDSFSTLGSVWHRGELQSLIRWSKVGFINTVYASERLTWHARPYKCYYTFSRYSPQRLWLAAVSSYTFLATSSATIFQITWERETWPLNSVLVVKLQSNIGTAFSLQRNHRKQRLKGSKNKTCFGLWLMSCTKAQNKAASTLSLCVIHVLQSLVTRVLIFLEDKLELDILPPVSPFIHWGCTKSTYLLSGGSCSSGLWGPVAMCASCVSQCVSGGSGLRACAFRSWCDTPKSTW